ncbi:MAG: hypothetical protein ACYCOX_18600 [Acidobacteriaceae bacterium]
MPAPKRRVPSRASNQQAVQLGILISQVENLTNELSQMRVEREQARVEYREDLAKLRTVLGDLEDKISRHKGFVSGVAFTFASLGTIVGGGIEYFLRHGK